MHHPAETHILKFSISFIEKSYRDRFEQIGTKPKIRQKFRNSLSHFRHFRESCIRKIPGPKQNPEDVYKMILSIVRNVPEEAYIISESTKLDDRFLNLDEALSEVIGFGASTIVSVIPGELAYYEGEDLGERFLLLKID